MRARMGPDIRILRIDICAVSGQYIHGMIFTDDLKLLPIDIFHSEEIEPFKDSSNVSEQWRMRIFRKCTVDWYCLGTHRKLHLHLVR